MINDLIRTSVFYCLSMIKNQNFVTKCLYQCKIMTDQQK